MIEAEVSRRDLWTPIRDLLPAYRDLALGGSVEIHPIPRHLWRGSRIPIAIVRVRWPLAPSAGED